jgi:hypothetical protein
VKYIIRSCRILIFVVIMLCVSIAVNIMQLNKAIIKLDDTTTEQAYQRKRQDLLWYDFYCSDCHNNKELWEVKDEG